jgi:hypothetical protein
MEKFVSAICVFSFVFATCFSQNQESPFNSNLRTVSTNVDPQADTMRAFRHLFERKRKGGATRAIVFGILGTASLIGTLSYKPSYLTINQGSAGSQRIETSSGPDAASYVFIGFSAIMTITGITQETKYSATNLESLLHGYKEGKALPLALKSKLKKKDFQ